MVQSHIQWQKKSTKEHDIVVCTTNITIQLKYIYISAPMCQINTRSPFCLLPVILLFYSCLLISNIQCLISQVFLYSSFSLWSKTAMIPKLLLYIYKRWGLKEKVLSHINLHFLNIAHPNPERKIRIKTIQPAECRYGS